MLIYKTLYYLLPFTASLGIACGVVSSYSVVRKLSFLGDIMSHSAFPGIALTFLFFPSATPLILMIGGAISAMLSVLFAFFIQKYIYTPKDTLLAIILSSFFSIGIVTVAIIQKIGLMGHSILNNFLFGNFFTLTSQDAFIGIVLCLLVSFLFIISVRMQILIGFDESYARINFPSSSFWEFIFLFCIIIIIIMGLQTVGLVLMGALIIIPGAVGKLLSKNYRSMLLYSASTGLLCCTGGTVLTILFPEIPTGPVIILTMSFLCIIIAGYFCFKNWINRFFSL